MRRGWLYILFLLIVLSCVPLREVYAQSSSLLADGVQDFIRREQLFGKVGIHNSLLNESFATGYKAVDSLLKKNTGNIWSPSKRKPILGQLEWLPVSAALQYNSQHPYGWSDGAMIPSRGIQTLVSAGFSLTSGNFTLQVKPEFVYAQNTAFQTFPEDLNDVYWATYYQLLNKSDIPERFGEKAYKKVFAGQSSIRFTKGALSAGISTENMWWGPGRYNALVMSNNAPGFLHATLNTVKPIETAVGSFEGQLIAGSLSSSDIAPPDTNRYYNGIRLYQQKQDKSRYIAGFMMSWQPKWVKGLFVGFTKASYLYRSDISGIADIFPLEGIIKSGSEKAGKKASLGSLFARYVMPEEHAELYFEFGRNDKSPSLINIATDNGYPRAYVAGFRKLFTSNKRKSYIEFASEFTQMELPNAELIQQSASWYTNPFVRQGYTNYGQVLGAGIGPGTNSQLIDISWVKGFTKVGLKFERIVRNSDFYYNAFVITQDFTRHWVDISTTLHANWQFDRFLLSSEMGLIRSLNYQWYILPGLSYFKNGYDVLNFHGNLSFAYRL